MPIETPSPFAEPDDAFVLLTVGLPDVASRMRRIGMRRGCRVTWEGFSWGAAHGLSALAMFAGFTTSAHAEITQALDRTRRIHRP